MSMITWNVWWGFLIDREVDQACWLPPVISALWEAKAEITVDHLRSGVQDQPGQHGKTPSLLKIQKLARRGGRQLWSQLLGRLRWEDHFSLGGRGCNEPRIRHCTPAWTTKWNFISEKKKDSVYLQGFTICRPCSKCQGPSVNNSDKDSYTHGAYILEDNKPKTEYNW